MININGFLYASWAEARGTVFISASTLGSISRYEGWAGDGLYLFQRNSSA